MKGDIILNPRAHSFQAGKQLHARSAHSISSTKMQHDATRHKGKQKVGDKLGDKLSKQGMEDKGRQEPPEGTPSNTKADTLR